MDQVYRSIPLLVIFLVFSLIAIVATVISSVIDPSDEVMYIHKWEEYFN